MTDFMSLGMGSVDTSTIKRGIRCSSERDLLVSPTRHFIRYPLNGLAQNHGRSLDTHRAYITGHWNSNVTTL